MEERGRTWNYMEERGRTTWNYVELHGRTTIHHFEDGRQIMNRDPNRVCLSSAFLFWGAWQNLWVKMAHSSGRQASPLRVATGGDASWMLEARRRRSPACRRNAAPPSAATGDRMSEALSTS